MSHDKYRPDLVMCDDPCKDESEPHIKSFSGFQFVDNDPIDTLIAGLERLLKKNLSIDGLTQRGLIKKIDIEDLIKQHKRAEPLSFYEWKETVMQGAGYAKDRSWFHQRYGRYCAAVRNGKWATDKLLSSNDVKRGE